MIEGIGGTTDHQKGYARGHGTHVAKKSLGMQLLWKEQENPHLNPNIFLH